TARRARDFVKSRGLVRHGDRLSAVTAFQFVSAHQAMHGVATMCRVLGVSTSAGVPNDILGPVFGFILVAYVIAIWQMRRYALPLGWAYAAYVVANGALFS